MDLEISVGDIFTMALATNEPNTTDLTGKTAFAWTAVPIRIILNGNPVKFEAEFIRGLDRIELRVS